MNSPSSFFAKCKQVLSKRQNTQSGDTRFFEELGKAWAAQLSVSLASQGIKLTKRQMQLPQNVAEGSITVGHDGKEYISKLDIGTPFPPIPAHLVALMFATQKILRRTLDPVNDDHVIDAVNYVYLSYDERCKDVEQ